MLYLKVVPVYDRNSHGWLCYLCSLRHLSWPYANILATKASPAIPYRSTVNFLHYAAFRCLAFPSEDTIVLLER